MSAAALKTEAPAAPSLAALLARASIEVTTRDDTVIDTLPSLFPAGIDVHVTFLPGDDYPRQTHTCVRVRQAGFNPIPHMPARGYEDGTILERHLSKLAEFAQVSRVLAIGGDVDKPRGPFPAVLDMLKTGLLPKYGVTSVLLAGHPEGHPAASDLIMLEALADKIAFVRGEGLEAQIVTQFGFEADPILDWMRRIRAQGIDAPVRLGVAGPASTTSLIKFAMRCGVGNSLRALRTRGAAIGKLLGETRPDDLLRALAAGWTDTAVGAVSGIHFYIFGGAARTAKWQRELVAALEAGG
jgi:methylenetetrahydrofolate reductase (NADPH)